MRSRKRAAAAAVAAVAVALGASGGAVADEPVPARASSFAKTDAHCEEGATGWLRVRSLPRSEGGGIRGRMVVEHAVPGLEWGIEYVVERHHRGGQVVSRNVLAVGTPDAEGRLVTRFRDLRARSYRIEFHAASQHTAQRCHASLTVRL